MPSPFSIGFVGGLAGGVVTSTFNQLIEPAKRSIRYRVNRKFPNELPAIGGVIHAWQRGIIPDAMLSFAASQLGATFFDPKNPLYEWENTLWQAVSQGQLSVPSPDLIMNATQMGLITDDAALQLLRRSGAEIPIWRSLRGYYATWIPENHLFVARNRGILTDAAFRNGLTRLGLNHDGIDSVYNRLREQLPGTGESTLFAAKGLLDSTAIAGIGLFDEMPANLETLYNAAGLHSVNDAMPQNPIGPADLTWAQLAWAGHWSTLGIGFVNTAMHRLRPGREQIYHDDKLFPQAFTLDDALKWLKINNVPPGMRDAVLATGFVPFDRRHLFAGRQTGEMTKAEAIEHARDMGMSTYHATLFANLMDARIEYANNAPIRQIDHSAISHTFRAASNAYSVGVLSRTQFLVNLESMGVLASAAVSHANAIDADLQTKRVQSILKALKRDYLNGAMNPFDLRNLLTQTGITAERIDYYMGEWQALRSLERRVATTEKILNWFIMGVITRDATYIRLLNLGWSDIDALLYIAEASLKIAKRDAAIQQQGFRNARQNAALIDRLARQSSSQAKSLQSELRRLTPPGRLITWLRQGTISDQWFEDRLRSMGYPDNIIQDYLAEAKKDGPLRDKSQPKSSAASNPTSPASSSPSST